MSTHAIAPWTLTLAACLCLVAACGDSSSPAADRGVSDASPAPDRGTSADAAAVAGDAGDPRADTGGPAPDAAPPAADAAPPAADATTPPPTGAPYGFVVPQDVGQTIGAGSLAPLPTAAYTGPMKITQPATIENVVIAGCLDIAASDVTLRNVVLKCTGLYPLDIRGTGSAPLNNVVVEHSRLECDSHSKLFMVADVTNLKVRHNELIGCDDFFFVGGKVDGLLVENNYMHGSTLTASSHADGFQIGEASVTTGTIAIRGNQILADTPGGRTGIVFATNQSQTTVRIENNFLDDWGYYTLRCNATTLCEVYHNIFAQTADHPTLINNGDIRCNRYEDGSFIAAGTNVGCPAYP